MPSRGDARRCATRSCSGAADGRRPRRRRCTRGSRSPTPTEAPVAPTTRRPTGVLALQLGHDRRAEGRDAPPRQPAGDRRHLRRAGARDRRRTTAACRSPSCSSRTASATRSRSRSPSAPPRSSTRDGRRPPACSSSSAPSSRPCSSPVPGFVAALLDADAARRVRVGPARRSRPARRFPAELQRRFSDRFGHPVLDGIGTTEALHIFISNTLGARSDPGRAGRRCPGTRLQLLDDDGSEVDRARHARLPPRRAAVDRRPATGSDRRHRGDIHRRLVAHRRRVHPIGRRLLDVPRPQQRHDQGRRDMGVAGRGRERARRAPRRARGRGRRRPQRPRAGDDRCVRRARAADTRSTPESIDAHCRDRMAAFKRPRQIVVVDELPKTATGKIRRFALRDDSPRRAEPGAWGIGPWGGRDVGVRRPRSTPHRIPPRRPHRRPRRRDRRCTSLRPRRPFR